MKHAPVRLSAEEAGGISIDLHWVWDSAEGAEIQCSYTALGGLFKRCALREDFLGFRDSGSNGGASIYTGSRPSTFVVERPVELVAKD